MKPIIIQTLQQLEAEYDVNIIYACEAGSRAWGIESQDSDYDVRFIYVRSKNAYLKLDTPRDVIELPIVGDLDINGWDIYKVLRLLRKANPSLLEWLLSPTVYLENSPIIASMRQIARSAIIPRVSLYYHYLHMAKGNYDQYIKSRPSIQLKKYLYVLRPLIMLLYLEQHDGVMPSTVNFPNMLDKINLSVETKMHIENLIKSKRAGDELGLGEHDVLLDEFIEGCLARMSTLDFADTYDKSAIFVETSAILELVLI